MQDPFKDQFFMIDKEILEFMSEFGKNKIVLEIGGGIGNLTKYLVKKARKVYVIEIDKKFEDILKRLGAEIIIGNALKVKWPKYEILISNPPYSIIEPLFWRLLRRKEPFILTVPKKFLEGKGKIEYLLKWFEIEILREVPKNSFDPPPNTESILIRGKVIGKGIMFEILKQWDKKLKNALLKVFWSKMTKREARDLIYKLNLDFLEKRVLNLSFDELKELEKKLLNVGFN